LAARLLQPTYQTQERLAGDDRPMTEMTDSVLYHDGNRQLQDAFDSRRVSDWLEEKLCRRAFTPDDKAFIESVIYFLPGHR
jgi:hypothetical protein